MFDLIMSGFLPELPPPKKKTVIFKYRHFQVGL
jgi:hypothetical protein